MSSQIGVDPKIGENMLQLSAYNSTKDKKLS